MVKRAILSVSNKEGIVELAQGLVEQGFELISTGGTYKTLTDAGIKLRYVTEITGFPEILDGRVKTLHPKIHGGILARGTDDHLQELEENGIGLIDLVVVNLYPFQETISKSAVTFQEAIENIDIGGPCMVRAAAKNQERVTVVVNPNRYKEILKALKEHGEIPLQMRQRLAAEAFAHTAEYDQAIAGYLAESLSQVGEGVSKDKATLSKGNEEVLTESNSKGFPEKGFPEALNLTAQKVQELRYGENPQQKAAFYRLTNEEGTLASGEQLQGKELSYNNWLDMDAAWGIVNDFAEPACTIIKHTNPCGTALGQNPLEAYERAYEADPVSAFGGIIAFNREIDEDCAQELVKVFYEVIIAPGFSEGAKEILKEKKNLRLIVVKEREEESPLWKVRSIQGGLLIQEDDVGTIPPEEWEIVTEAQPTAEDLRELDFAWRVVKHVKSNAIVLAKDKQTLGVGAGQMNRVGSVKISLEQAGEKAKGAYLASDAFFPFPDSLEEAAKAGIRGVVQPGGSIRDEEVIA
ncbi:MAG: bifunctional phosphoribosylaminoimidazolecarboxamide formyltransferase/IMP cyclohydrolase, partial [Desulfitobacterium sp.]|nr:bifunctional phosphoribosylaminoimidazolecarboxamide formyltransferase/IMP cyclohydrolase [Desulfitobacterium sp.]